MIFIGVGGNLNGASGAGRVFRAAQTALQKTRAARVLQVSRTYTSAPQEKHRVRLRAAVRSTAKQKGARPAEQKAERLYYNEVWQVTSVLAPRGLLHVLQKIEQEFGRMHEAARHPPLQHAAWRDRVLDLDLLAWGNLRRTAAPLLPHPRLAARGFVLYPLSDLAPAWRHPTDGTSIATLKARLAQASRPLKSQ